MRDIKSILEAVAICNQNELLTLVLDNSYILQVHESYVAIRERNELLKEELL